MKKTLIMTCALAISLTTSTALAATVTKNIKGTNVSVTSTKPDSALNKAAKAKADYDKAKADAAKAKADAKAAKANAKANAKKAAKAKANAKINKYTEKKGVSVKIK